MTVRELMQQLVEEVQDLDTEILLLRGRRIGEARLLVQDLDNPVLVSLEA